MKISITILLGILMITSVMAMYAGETETIILPEQYEYYTIVGNNSPVDLEIIQDGLNLTIIPNKYMKNDSFSLVFFNKEKEIITNTVIQTIHTGGGGGGSRIVYVDRNITKNIPIYTDVEVIKEVPVEKEVEKIVEVVKNQTIIIIIILLLLGSFVIFMLWRRRFEKNEE